jgi:SAM-dependent methyltransferase
MSPGRRRSGERWSVITDLIGDDWRSVLDVGCGDRRLREHLPRESKYTGLDLVPPADVIASAENPLPFDADAFDCVVLADVLEHLNNPHAALDEALRVAGRSVIVLLPNVLSLAFRLGILAGRLPAKYRFGPHASLDRHRWLMNFDQAAGFTRGRAELNGWIVTREYAYTLPFRRFSARTAYALARYVSGPNVWAWEYMARLEPER